MIAASIVSARGVRAACSALLLTMLIQAGCSRGPTEDASPGDAPDLVVTVSSFNIFHGEGLDGRVDLDRVAATIRSSGAEVVGLQEVDRFFDHRSAYADQAAVLSDLLDMHMRFGPSIDAGPTSEAATTRRQYGVALLSRYPIVNSWVNRLPSAEGSEGRVALGATIAMKDGKRLDVVVSHLGNGGAAERVAQAERLADFAGLQSSCSIALIDANSGPRSETLSRLTQRLRDAWTGTSDPGFTHPTRMPRSRIDFVLASPDLDVRSVRVQTSDASDHLPVVASLTIPSACS